MSMIETRMKKIVQKDAKVLRQTAKPVAKKDLGSAKLAKLLSDMSAALKTEEHGVALAAPQIGVSSRIFIVSGKVLVREAKDEGEPLEESPEDIVFINPEIIRASRKKSDLHEGCLSVRGTDGKSTYGHVKRHAKVSVRALDEDGNTFTYHGAGLMAQIFQHEIDHLNGILFIDKAERLDEEPA